MATQTSQAASVRAGYETIFITRPEMTDDALKALQERLTNVVSSVQRRNGSD